MTATVRQMKRRAAKRPKPRTVTVTLPEESEYAGWEVTAKADFPVKVLLQLQSGNLEEIMAALDSIVLDHNLPNDQDEIAATMADVDPWEGLGEVGNGVFDAIGKLPNR